MRINICDDDKRFRITLKKVVERECELLGIECEIREYGSGEELLSGGLTADADLLFLDIEMGGLNGMEMAKELRRQQKGTVLIFVTAYPDFVFQGYEVHAFHYILKPCEDEKIKRVFHMALKETGQLKEQYYLIEQKSGVMKLALSKVLYFKSDRKKIKAYMKDRSEEFYGSLSEMEGILPSYFVRSHNRYLVNLNFVTKVEGRFCICGEEELPVSRGSRQGLLVAFARMMLR